MANDADGGWKEMLEQDIRYALDRMPEYKELLEMYSEMLTAQRETKLKLGEPELDMDANRVAVCANSGVVLLKEVNPELDLEAAKELFFRLKGITASKGTEYSDQSASIDAAIKDGKLDLEALLGDAFRGTGSEEIKKKAIDLGIEPHYFAMLVNSALRPNLEVYAEKLTKMLDETDWERPFCPVCGRLPFMSRLVGQEGKRSLCCPGCSTEWRFPRLKCINCGIEDHEKLRMLYADETTREQYADVCDNCKRYLKGVDVRKMTRPPMMHISDAATLHLDMLAQREGFVAL